MPWKVGGALSCELRLVRPTEAPKVREAAGLWSQTIALEENQCGVAHPA